MGIGSGLDIREEGEEPLCELVSGGVYCLGPVYTVLIKQPSNNIRHLTKLWNFIFSINYSLQCSMSNVHVLVRDIDIARWMFPEQNQEL